MFIFNLCNNLIFLACFSIIIEDFVGKLPLFFLQSQIDWHIFLSFNSFSFFSMIYSIFQFFYNSQAVVLEQIMMGCCSAMENLPPTMLDL